MKNKNHGNGQGNDEKKFVKWFMTIMIALTIIATIIEIATWFIK